MKHLGFAGIMFAGIMFAGIMFATLPVFAAAPDAPKDISGKWEIHVSGYGEPRTQKFDLKQNGQELTGIYEGKFGESKVSGTVKDSAVDFEMRVIEQDHIITVHYTGTAADDGFKGTVTFGDIGKGTWVASKGFSNPKKKERN